MEVFGPHNTSACLDITSSGGSSTDPDHLTQYSSKDLSMNDLKTCLTEFFDVEDTESSTNQLNLFTGKDYVVNDVNECECQILEKDAKGKSASGKCLSKCTTFPPSCGSKSSVDSLNGEKEKEEVSAEVSEVNGSIKSSDKCYSRSMSLPVHLKPASAMKGSREKQGIPPKNLSVTWAPDVYDPVPTSVSHVPSNKNQNYRSKKSGKYKQKSASKSSRGSKSKDKDKIKKQVRRSGGGTRLKPFYDDNGTSFGEPQDFDVGTPDPFCGSSYLTKSVTNLHFSVAEAT